MPPEGVATCFCKTYLHKTNGPKKMVLLGRIELPASSLPMTRSTTELQQLIANAAARYNKKAGLSRTIYGLFNQTIAIATTARRGKRPEIEEPKGSLSYNAV